MSLYWKKPILINISGLYKNININLKFKFIKKFMIVRKPTKIELKPEDDLYEYEEYKKKQLEISKKTSSLEPKQSSKFQDKLLMDPNSNPFKMSMANEIFKTPSVGIKAPNNLNPNQPATHSSSQFDSFNLLRNQIGGQEFDMMRNDSPHINQLFSILLNNLNSGQSFSNIYSSGNAGNPNNGNTNDPSNPNNPNNSG